MRVKPALTKKDEADINVGIDEDIAFFALSFVREPGDLDIFHKACRTAAGSRGHRKNRGSAGHLQFDEIIVASDGLMIARGDLGIECPFEDLPQIQSKATNSCIQHTKPVIVATHMLESMIDSPIPTRAEVTDVTNAIREQADCIMLSGETTVGKYPVECVQTMNRIARRTETEHTEILRQDIILRQPKSRCCARRPIWLPKWMLPSGLHPPQLLSAEVVLPASRRADLRVHRQRAAVPPFTAPARHRTVLHALTKT